MNRLYTKKLNFLLNRWPAGVILTSKWLKENGYYKQLVKLYCDNGWLKSVGRSAYARLNDEVTWQGAVNAIQSQLNMAVHVGGLTALQLYGVTQYLVLGDNYLCRLATIIFAGFLSHNIRHLPIIRRCVNAWQNDYSSTKGDLYELSPKRLFPERCSS